MASWILRRHDRNRTTLVLIFNGDGASLELVMPIDGKQSVLWLGHKESLLRSPYHPELAGCNFCASYLK